MPEPADNSVASEHQSHRPLGIVWQAIRFVVHLGALYVLIKWSTPWLSSWARETLLPLLRRPSTSGGIEFFSNHILAFSAIPAVLGGLANARFKHKVACFVWIVPALILAYKFFTFPASVSVLDSHSAFLGEAFHRYFESGFRIPETRGWEDFWKMAVANYDLWRALDQFMYTAPFYGGVAYSLAAWIGMRTDLPRKVSEMVKEWEKRRFEDSDRETRGSITPRLQNPD